MKNDFTHLHVHSEFSLLDGAIKIDALCKYVAELGMSSIALTDHGVMSGAIDFYKAAKKNGIKPIIGVEAYITNDPDNIPKPERTRDNYHLILLAQTQEGYRNLIRMLTYAGQSNFYFKPRISKDMLRAHSAGVIATSGCLAGEVARARRQQRESLEDSTKIRDSTEGDTLSRATRIAAEYADIFQSRFYIELQDHDGENPEQRQHNTVAIQVAKDLNLPCVITADAHYLRKEDKRLHDLLMAIQLKKTIDEYQGDGYFAYGNTFIRSQEQMLESALRVESEEAFYNTTELAARIEDLVLDDINPQAPHFQLDKAPDYIEFLTWLNNPQHSECR